MPRQTTRETFRDPAIGHPAPTADPPQGPRAGQVSGRPRDGQPTAALARRGLLTIPLLALPFRATGAAAPPPLRFRVVREGSQIGTHQVGFTEAGGVLTARTEVEIAVRLLGVTVFRFAHRFTEDWAAGRLRQAVSRRDRNGSVTELRAEAAGDALLVQGSAGRFRLPADAAPLTWWDSGRFARPLFDNDTGEPLRLRWTRSALPGGGALWRSSGDEESEGLYAADGTWTGWKTRAEDGSVVVYEPAA